MIQLGFYGAAGEVTGSCYLVTTSRARILVDFGLFQGSQDASPKNRQMPPIDPAHIDAVVLTHGHLDHCGRLPLLYKAGFRGPIYTTQASCDITGLILRDAAEIQETDAERRNQRRAAEGLKPLPPIYTIKEAEQVLGLLRSLPYGREQEVGTGVRALFVDAGHILGAASVRMTIRDGDRELVIAFSGDIGVAGTPILRDPQTFDRADVMLLESTYGDRDHRPYEDSVTELCEILHRCKGQSGKVLIPAFAVGRTQDLIFHMGKMVRQGRVGPINVYVDSPMALAASTLYRQHLEVYDAESRAIMAAGQEPLNFPGLHFTHTVEESKRLNTMGGGAVVISASGMCTGGRILHHLKHGLGRPETCLVFVGYQGKGTLGRELVDGAKRVWIMGEPVTVRASVHTLGGFSAHAGQSGLLAWAASLKQARPRVFLTHGEEGPRQALRLRLDSDLGMKAACPMWGDVVEL